MTPLRDYFESKVTIGNLLTIAVFIIGGVAGYTRLESQVANLQTSFKDHNIQQAIERNEYVRKDVQNERNKFIDQQLSEIKERLDEILRAVKAVQ